MKRIFFLCCALAGLTEVKAQTLEHATQTVQTAAKEVLQFRETEYDFGKIPQGKPVFYFFEITNTGDAPIKVDNVQASCGCTTPEWNKEAIPPGGSDKIKVGFNAATEGGFDKYITVTYNGNASKQIKIKGFVWKAPAGSAPANPSVQFLKNQIQ